jgi:hypothetical protein
MSDYLVGWIASWSPRLAYVKKLYSKFQAEQVAEIARKTQEVEDEIWAHEVVQMAVREVERVVSTMSHSICIYMDGILTELYRALLLLLTLLSISLLSVHPLPSDLNPPLFRPLPLALRRMLNLSPRKAYVISQDLQYMSFILTLVTAAWKRHHEPQQRHQQRRERRRQQGQEQRHHHGSER